jgi:polyphosphate kinase 2 (PPK2 family)
MVAHTPTAIAPWTLVEANDKKFARIKVLRSLIETIDTRLGGFDQKSA